MRLLLLILLSTTCTLLFSQSPIGVWKTVDDATGENKSLVEIYEKNGLLEGAVRELLLKPSDTLCEACEGDLKNKPVLGMIVIENMKQQGDQWKSGTILDPETGKTYKCILWFDEGNSDLLKVRGKHWTGLYRTQDWHRTS